MFVDWKCANFTVHAKIQEIYFILVLILKMCC